MSRDPSRLRIDYSPSPKAQAALEEASSLVGAPIGVQALLDRLVLLGVWCAKREHDRPPPLRSLDRSEPRRSVSPDFGSRNSRTFVPGAVRSSPGTACTPAAVCSTMPATRAPEGS